jgi:hypothetical protein
MTSPDEPMESRADAPEPPAASARRRGARTGRRPAPRLRPPSATARRLLSFAVAPLAVVLVTFVVASPSYSVFNQTTSDTANAWAAGTVVLQNNSSGTNAQTGSALFNASGLQPNGPAVSKCVAVTATGTTPSTVSLYVSSLSPTGTNSVGYYTLMTVAIGTGSSGTSGDCTGFTQTGVLATSTRLTSMPATFTAGATGWAPTGNGSETRVFKFTYSLDNTIPNTLQGSTVAATFTWEAQS